MQWLMLVVCMAAVRTETDFLSSADHQSKSKLSQRSSLWERLIPSLEHRLDLFPDEFEEVVGPVRRDDRELTVSFRPLCETVIVRKEFNRTTHEYRPPYYHEVLCKVPEFRGTNSQVGHSLKNSEMCMYPGYSCIQRKREMFVTRRRFETNCWETVAVTVPSNCECMWPESRNGDIE